MSHTLSREKRLEPTERDCRILAVLAVSRLASVPQLAALIDEPVTQGLVRRLQKLNENRYLDRPRNQAHFTFDELRRYQGKKPLVYALGDAGADHLAALGRLDRRKIYWRKKNREIKELQIAHALKVTDVRACLHRVFPAPHGDPHLYHWQQGDALTRVFFTDEHGSLVKRELAAQRHVVDPDAFFALRGSAGGKIVGRYLFLEVDRATMDAGRILRKLRDYFRLWKCDLHRTYDGIDRFRVLTLTTTRERARNLCDVARRADDQERGSRHFLFASAEDVSLESPEALARPTAVLSPGESGPVSLW